MDKKKYFALLCFICLLPLISFSQAMFSYSKHIDGFWGEWEQAYSYTNYDRSYTVYYYLQGTYDDFVVYKNHEHPSNYIMRVKINGMNQYLKKSKENKRRKRRFEKNKADYEFSGTAEIIVAANSLLGEVSDLGTFIEKFPSTNVKATDKHSKKLTIPIKVYFEPFVGKPGTYNISLGSKKGLAIGIKD